MLLKLDAESEPLLACVYEHTGIFTVDSGYFFHVGVHYDVAISQPSPMRTVDIPTIHSVAHLKSEVIVTAPC